MYKPFNFDPNKKYPIITYVYPGPQQEGTRHTFTATAGEQQLAQIGFIVIQVGHRGGTPGRSKAYASYGYFNLRDYALDDKKTAIEQLAQRFSFIDVERVGIYGHSGGGFMTAAALMVPPYNDFFKAGFSTAGNHDNNIYNNSWSERWHGLKEVPIEEETASTRQEQSRERTQQRSGPSDLKARLSVDPEDFFYDYEMANNEDQWDLDRRMWGEEEPLPLWLQDQVVERQREQELQEEQQRTERQEGQTERGQERRQQRGGRRGQQRRQDQENDSQRGNREQNQEEQDGEKKNLNEEKENDEKEKGKEKETDGEKQVKDEKDVKQDEQDEDQERDQETKEVERKTRFEIRVPSNAELAENLKHHLFLVHGELDNNVHPANTLRLVDALIKANKRFDMMYLPGTRHGFGSYQPYVTQRMFEFFAERLLSDYQAGADMKQH
jgi:dienelactone hydrolase